MFVTTSLTLGLLISTLAGTQVQAFQITFFTFLPQILLSGFMFPFDGMPRAAQLIAEVLPLTHFVRIIRGILLRGATLAEVHAEIWPLLAFLVVAMARVDRALPQAPRLIEPRFADGTATPIIASRVTSAASSLLAPPFGSGRPQRQHQIARLRARIPDADRHGLG